jgi:hypothetical protein
MFPQLRERFGSALDLVVEFSTLGEYRLGADGALYPASALTPVLHTRPAPPDAQPPAPEREPQLGGAGAPNAARAAVRRIVAGGAAGLVPVATPAARRAHVAATARRAAAAKPAGDEPACGGERRHRASGHRRPRRAKAVAPEQLCLAV